MDIFTLPAIKLPWYDRTPDESVDFASTTLSSAGTGFECDTVSPASGKNMIIKCVFVKMIHASNAGETRVEIDLWRYTVGEASIHYFNPVYANVVSGYEIVSAVIPVHIFLPDGETIRLYGSRSGHDHNVTIQSSILNYEFDA